MSENIITLAMRRARAKAKLEDLTFHDLRHEATSRLFESTDLDILEILVTLYHFDNRKNLLRTKTSLEEGICETPA